MVQTVKFSAFANAGTLVAGKTVVGLSSAINAKFDIAHQFIADFTTATRPTPPQTGMIGFNTDTDVFEWYNGTTWLVIGTSSITSPNNTIISNISGAPAVAIANTLSDILDSVFTSTQGSIIYRDASSWDFLVPGSNGQVLKTSGAGTNPSWSAVPGLTPAALTKTDDTNVTLTLGGTPATALLQAVSLTLGWSGELAPTRGGTGIGTYILGDTLYGSGVNTLAKLAGNTTAVKQYLSQTGTGAVSAAPAWATISGGDVTGAALSKADDTNVTLTLSGTPLTALLQAVTITAGWSGVLSMARGGSNKALVADNGGIVYSDADSMEILAATATAGQIIRSGANSAPSWSTATYPAAAGTSGNVLASDGTNWLSTSAAGIGSPLTTKGDLYTFTTVNARLAVGSTNGQILQVNSGDATGLSWSTATYPSTATNVARILRSNGTNWVETTSTFADTYTASGFLYANGANNVAGLATANNGLPVTNNTGVPSILAGPGTTGNLLQSNAAAAPSWSTSTFPSVGGAAGNILISDGTNYIASTSLWPNTVGSAGKILRSNGTSNAYTTATYPDVATSTGSFLYADGTNYVASTSLWPNTVGTSGKFLISNGTSNGYSTSTIPTSAGATANKVLLSDGTNYVLSTPTFPNASATARKIIVSDGTNWLASTETYATPGTTGNVLTSDGTNWVSSPVTGNGTVNSGTANQLAYYATTGTAVSGLTSANNGTLVTDNTGVPSILAGPGTAGKFLKSAAAAAPLWSTNAPITSVVVQKFTSSGTYTPTSGMVYCIIECLGSGAAGGGATSTSANYGNGGGGGSGSYSKITVTAATVGASQTVTVGAAGTAGTAGNNPGGNGADVSVGTICVGKGGTGGGGGSTNGLGAGGAGGVAGTGDLTATGNNGGGGIGVLASTLSLSGAGGNSIWGGGGLPASTGSGVGGAANLYGAGGAGGSSFNTANVQGGVGSKGIVIITEYIAGG